MRRSPRIIAVIAAVAAFLAGAAYAAADGTPIQPASAHTTTPVIGGPGPVKIPIPACTAAKLAASYTLDPFSQGLGHVSYTLIIENGSRRTSCRLYGARSFRLLGRDNQALPTHATTSPGGRYAVTLAPLQWAQADSRFSPDVPGPGEGSPCEQTATALRIGIGGGGVIAPMDPTPVCEHGAISFTRLAAVPIHRACRVAGLTATFKRVGSGGDYGLALENTGARACWLDGVPELQLLGRSGRELPTYEVYSEPYLIVVAPHGEVSSLAMLSTHRGPGEPRHGPCEPKAAKVQISLVPRIGYRTIPLTPPVSVCHHGQMSLSGLVQGFPFS